MEDKLKEIAARLSNKEGYHHTSHSDCDRLCDKRGCCVKDRRYLLARLKAAEAVCNEVERLLRHGIIGDESDCADTLTTWQAARDG